MSLPKVHRLQSRKDFQRVYQSSLRRSGVYMTVRAVKIEGHPAENLPATRFGISISQKVSKKSVVRNLIKRRIKAVIRQLLTEILPGWLVVIIVKPTAIECFYDEILRELKELLLTAEVRKSYGNSGRSDL